ncbi:hypothetical protein RAS1_27660 [Phycisphaerae bacterium RAS1]|nr:hypothetical protein RAS1_27660 [Phycisphaerae bacterium RAS1]
MAMLKTIKRNVTKVALGATVCQLGLMGGGNGLGGGSGMGCDQAAQLFATGMELGYQAQTGQSLFSPAASSSIFGEESLRPLSESVEPSFDADMLDSGFDAGFGADESFWG